MPPKRKRRTPAGGKFVDDASSVNGPKKSKKAKHVKLLNVVNPDMDSENVDSGNGDLSAEATGVNVANNDTIFMQSTDDLNFVERSHHVNNASMEPSVFVQQTVKDVQNNSVERPQNVQQSANGDQFVQQPASIGGNGQYVYPAKVIHGPVQEQSQPTATVQASHQQRLFDVNVTSDQVQPDMYRVPFQPQAHHRLNEHAISEEPRTVLSSGFQAQQGMPNQVQPNLQSLLVTLTEKVSKLEEKISNMDSGHHRDTTSGNNILPVLERDVHGVINTMDNASVSMLSSSPVKVYKPASRQLESRSLVYAPKLGDTLPQTIRNKIQDHKYVDFRDILNFDKPQNQTLVVQDNTLVLQNQRRRPLSFMEWNSAWRLFFSIYVAAHSDETQTLLSYVNDIHAMEAAGLNWTLYDELFRRGRENVQYPWDTIRPDLDRKISFIGHTAVNDRRRVGATGFANVNGPNVSNKNVNVGMMGHASHSFRSEPSSFQSQSQLHDQPFRPESNSFQSQFQVSVPKGFCIAFHSTSKICKYGENCVYKHLCFRCFRDHPIYLCSDESSSKSPEPPKVTETNAVKPQQSQQK